MKRIHFIFTVFFIVAEAVVEFNWTNLKGKPVTTSDKSDGEKAIDDDVTTHVTITSETRSLVVDLGSSSSEVWIIDSVRITPARPTHAAGVTGGADKRDTSKCMFPFKKKNELQNKCVDSGFGFRQCSFGEHLELSDWSSCNGDQPDGSLSDKITVSLSMSKTSSKMTVCGTTDNSSFNANRIVRCPPKTPTFYLVLTKQGNMQIAEAYVKAYSIKKEQIDHTIKLLGNPWKAGEEAKSGLSISGTLLPFKIPKIIWYHQPLNSTEKPKKVGTTIEGEELIPSRISYKHSGYYHFEYANSNDEIFYKSNTILIQVHYQSNFTTKLKTKYSGSACPEKSNQIDISCAVGFSYPHPNITMKLANKESNKELPCQYAEDLNKYGGKSVRCSLKLQLKPEYNNTELICQSSQPDVQKYFQETSATVFVEECEGGEVVKKKEDQKYEKGLDFWIYIIIGVACLVFIIFVFVLACCCCKRSGGTYV